jgi:UDP-glucose 4-epimerase
MPRILVTGAGGFLGSHLCDHLLARGWEVVGLDDWSHGNEANLASARGHPAFTALTADVRDGPAVDAAAAGVNAVAHLAAYKIPRYGGRLRTLDVNALGTRTALEAARRAGARFLFASTSDCYGKNPALPFSEATDSVLGPARVARWAYAASKMFGEHLCYGYAEEYGLPVRLVRIFGSYGPRQNRSWWGGPQAVFAELAMDGKPLEIHGDGQQTRSFTFVSDTVAGLLAVLEAGPEADGELFNVGGDEEVTIAELARTVWRLVRPGEEPRLEFVPYDRIAGRPYEDVRRRRPDASRLRALGWRPLVPLEEGLRQTLEWQRLARGA